MKKKNIFFFFFFYFHFTMEYFMRTAILLVVARLSSVDGQRDKNGIFYPIDKHSQRTFLILLLTIEFAQISNESPQQFIYMLLYVQVRTMHRYTVNTFKTKHQLNSFIHCYIPYDVWYSSSSFFFFFFKLGISSFCQISSNRQRTINVIRLSCYIFIYYSSTYYSLYSISIFLDMMAYKRSTS